MYDLILTGDDVGFHAADLSRPLNQAGLEAACEVMQNLLDLPLLDDERAGAAQLGATMLVRLLARRLDPDVTIGAVNMQLQVLGYPPHHHRAIRPVSRSRTELHAKEPVA